jgi:hypothetical protein
METYSGKPAATLKAKDFITMAWVERRQIGHFLKWMSQMERLAKGKSS